MVAPWGQGVHDVELGLTVGLPPPPYVPVGHALQVYTPPGPKVGLYPNLHSGIFAWVAGAPPVRGWGPCGGGGGGG